MRTGTESDHLDAVKKNLSYLIRILPSDAGCTGVRSGALAGLAGVWEIYIPAGITCIEPGAFGDLGEEVYVEVHPDNPAYMSVNGILYTKTGEKAL